MNSSKLWPLHPLLAVIASVVLFALLCGALYVVQRFAKWPPNDLQHIVLWAVLALSAIPIIFAVVDYVANQRGSIGYKEFKIDFSTAAATVKFTSLEPASFGPDAPAELSYSAAMVINETLARVVASDIVKVDLKDGDAWWVTRLLMLCVGAVRVGSPAAIVFVNSSGIKREQFLAWARPKHLINELRKVERLIPEGGNPVTITLRSRTLQNGGKVAYGEIYDQARYIASLLPTAEYLRQTPAGQAFLDPFGPARYVAQNSYVCGGSVITENILLDHVGILQLENPPDQLSEKRFGELFGTCAYAKRIGLDDAPDKQFRDLRSCEGQYIPFTRDGEFVNLIDSSTVLRYIASSGVSGTS